MPLSAQLETIIGSIDRLPPFPGVASRVLELSADPNIDYLDLLNVIKYDEALTANCLRLCNSSYYGLPVKVFSLDHAGRLLGLKNIIMVVLANCKGLSTFSNPLNVYGLRPGELWRHSVICAILSQLLVEKTNGADDSVLFTATLLHDVGKLVLNQYYVEETSKDLVELTFKDGLSLIEAEKEVFGIDHAELGGIIAESWQFPAVLSNSIRNHHQEMSGESIPNVESWVRLSNLVFYVSLSHLVHSYHKGITCQIEPEVLSRFGLSQEDIKKVMVELPEELKSTEALLKIFL